MRSTVRLRLARLEDAHKFWEWRNEEETRAASFNTDPIRYEDHLQWFEKRIKDLSFRFLIVVDERDQEVGYARLDVSGDSAHISLSIDRKCRGRGLGTKLIQAATEFAHRELSVARVVAHIRSTNQASLTAFRRAGYTLSGDRRLHGTDALEMISERNATKTKLQEIPI